MDKQPAPAGDDELREAEWRVMVNAFVQDNLGSRDLAYGFLMGALSKLHERGRELEQLRTERGAWDQRMDDLREEFRKTDDVRLRQLKRAWARVAELEQIEQRAREIADNPDNWGPARHAVRQILGEEA